MKIQIIVGSTRQGRATPRVAAWVEKTAASVLDGVEVEKVDLMDYELPFFDDAMPPMANQDRHPASQTQKWLDKLAEADGYVFVVPEYNHGMPAALKNAIDFVDVQLKRKPVALVSHGVNGGARASEMAAQVLRSIGAVPIPEIVAINGMIGYSNLISEAGELLAESVQGAQSTLENTLASLVWYAEALKTATSL